MSTSLISSIFLVGSTVLRQKVASGKFGAFAFFNQTRPLAVRSAMLRLRSVALMSAGATLLGFMYGLIVSLASLIDIAFLAFEISSAQVTLDW